MQPQDGDSWGLQELEEAGRTPRSSLQREHSPETPGSWTSQFSPARGVGALHGHRWGPSCGSPGGPRRGNHSVPVTLVTQGDSPVEQGPSSRTGGSSPSSRTC